MAVIAIEGLTEAQVQALSDVQVGALISFVKIATHDDEDEDGDERDASDEDEDGNEEDGGEDGERSDRDEDKDELDSDDSDDDESITSGHEDAQSDDLDHHVPLPKTMSQVRSRSLMEWSISMPSPAT